MLAEDIWDYDKKKIDLIKNNGYNLEVVWENDYNKDPKLIYKIIKKYVKKN
jgi:G:T-mismatch repair DNA endonuclease (very short patch repair protein)